MKQVDEVNKNKIIQKHFILRLKRGKICELKSFNLIQDPLSIRFLQTFPKIEPCPQKTKWEKRKTEVESQFVEI